MSTKLEIKKKRLLEFSGCMTPVVTPYDQQGQVDSSQILGYARYLSEVGASGLYILGTTGEGLLQTLEDKIQIAKAWNEALLLVNKETTGKSLLAIVHISAMSLLEVETFLNVVDSLDFDGVAILQPIYYKINDPIKLVEYFKKILKDRPMPFLFYHNQFRTGGFEFDFNKFLVEALNRLPQFCAVKFSDDNVLRLASAIELCGDRVNIMAGMNDMCFVTRCYGIKAGICSCMNLQECIHWYHSLLKAFDRNAIDDALSAQKAIDNICEPLKLDGNFIGALKAKMNKSLRCKGLFFGESRWPIL